MELGGPEKQGGDDDVLHVLADALLSTNEELENSRRKLAEKEAEIAAVESARALEKHAAEGLLKAERERTRHLLIRQDLADAEMARLKQEFDVCKAGLLDEGQDFSRWEASASSGTAFGTAAHTPDWKGAQGPGICKDPSS